MADVAVIYQAYGPETADGWRAALGAYRSAIPIAAGDVLGFPRGEHELNLWRVEHVQPGADGVDLHCQPWPGGRVHLLTERDYVGP